MILVIKGNEEQAAVALREHDIDGTLCYVREGHAYVRPAEAHNLQRKVYAWYNEDTDWTRPSQPGSLLWFKV